MYDRNSEERYSVLLFSSIKCMWPIWSCYGEKHCWNENLIWLVLCAIYCEKSRFYSIRTVFGSLPLLSNCSSTSFLSILRQNRNFYSRRDIKFLSIWAYLTFHDPCCISRNWKAYLTGHINMIDKFESTVRWSFLRRAREREDHQGWQYKNQ